MFDIENSTTASAYMCVLCIITLTLAVISVHAYIYISYIRNIFNQKVNVTIQAIESIFIYTHKRIPQRCLRCFVSLICLYNYVLEYIIFNLI